MQPKFSIADLKQRLREHHCKMTPQRREVLEVFLSNEGEHLNAEKIYKELKEHKESDIGLATIYRTLELMCDIDILRRLELFDDGCAFYELNMSEPNAHQHHHLICKKCHKVIEFSDALLESLESSISKQCGFKIVDHQLKFFGYCQECQ